ncbi:alpha/beta fold hydrolase [Microbulbifer sp. ANSA005]|uniref:alpha/beta fold hydrolase n=1 Tax=Microbulbifer sp. ANSA005 TaxID=3243362 RepID=UPI004042EA28
MKLHIRNSSIKKAICSLSLAIAFSGCSMNASQEEGATKVNEQELISVESLFNESAIKDVNLSSDGQWLAWLQQHNGAPNIYVMSADGASKDAFALTEFVDGVDAFFWDKHRLGLFVLKDVDGNEQHQVYRLDLNVEGKSLNLIGTEKLTPNDSANYMVLGQSSENQDSLTLIANHDDPKNMNFYELNVETGELTFLMENTHRFYDVLIDDEGVPVAGVRPNPDTSKELFVRKGGSWEGVLKTEPGEILSLSSYNSEIGSLFFESSFGRADTSGVKQLDLTSGKIAAIHQDPNQRSDVYKTLFNKEGELQLVSYYYGYREDYPVDESFQKHWQNITSNFSRRVEIDVVSMDEETGVWLLEIASDIDPGAFYRYQQSDQSLVRLIDKDSQLDPKFLSEKRSITYTARDGITIQAYLTLPKGKSKQLPLVVLPHGGPWARDYWKLSDGFMTRLAQFLVNRGYAVLQPNFRASTGFGETFIALGNREWGTGAMQHDLTDGVEFLIEQGIADSDRVAIMGGSYGGYAALSGLTFTPDTYTAAISFVGPSSLITLLESFPEYYRPFISNWFKAVGDPLIESDREEMQSRSPLNYTDRIKAPLLLVQGANDPRVTQVESDQIAKKMYENGLDVEYILAKDEGHGFSKRINKLALLIKTEDFLAEHLGGEVSPLVSDQVATHLAGLEVDISSLSEK